jgi:dCTP deaminase
MIESGEITGADVAQINPASLDLSVSGTIFRTAGLVRPKAGETVESLLPLVQATAHDLRQPLERNVTYLVLLNERVKLYLDSYGWANPKSSTGRHGVHVRLLADGGEMYDCVPLGYEGPLWLAITPLFYPILIKEGDRLVQLRIFNAKTKMNRESLSQCWDEFKLLWRSEEGGHTPILFNQWRDAGRIDADGSILLTPWIPTSEQVAGYQCQGTRRVLDLSARGVEPSDFYRPIYPADSGCIHLLAGNFYILSTAEIMVIPPGLSCEVRDVDSRFGELRAHYAGYIDPGWGYGHDGGGSGRQITLEVVPHEDILLRAGDIVTAVKIERMIREPEHHYDALDTSNYRVQEGPKLAKQFASMLTA